MASPRVYLNPFAAAGPALALYIGNYFSGAIRWVSSTHAAASDANTGLEPELPKLTYTSAQTASAAGDVILVGASHVETISAAATHSTADVLSIGLGTGSTKPRFTSAVAGAMWTASAAGIGYVNFVFPASTAATTGRIVSSSTECLIRLCDFEAGANDTTTVLSFSGNNPLVQDCTITATASRPARGIRITGAIAGSRFIGVTLDGSTYGWTSAAFSVEAAATRVYMENIRLANHSDVIFTTTGSSYKMLGVRPVDNTGSRVDLAA